ncbi:MAG: methionyl-tRNA formyltransferase [Gammaproteobacteria bacterium]|nr:methionyl-tRNA formyltransferase [Gammaproteobacteria bacterium]
MRLAFAGTPAFAVPALEALHAAGHDIRGVFTQADRPAGRGRVAHPSPVKLCAAQLGLTVLQPATFKSAEAVDLLRDLDVDVFVVAAYGLILPAVALTVPRFGCINIHASLLPRWRGAAPIQRALLAGDAVTGVSIMRMEPGLDTGPVLATRGVDITPQDTAQTLTATLATVGAGLVCRTVEALARGEAVETPQPMDGVSYAAKVDKAEALVDWSADAVAIERRVRAFNPWPIAETRHRGLQLRIWEAGIAPPDAQEQSAGVAPGTVRRVSKEGIDVACGRGTLRITRLQLPGRKVQDAANFAHAESLPGARFTGP